MEENISNKDNHDRIELRSEKVRNIIGAVHLPWCVGVLP